LGEEVTEREELPSKADDDTSSKRHRDDARIGAVEEMEELESYIGLEIPEELPPIEEEVVDEIAREEESTEGPGVKASEQKNSQCPRQNIKPWIGLLMVGFWSTRKGSSKRPVMRPKTSSPWIPWMMPRS
jgi:hypothetical protein